MVKVQAGDFLMGAPEQEPEALDSERPVHSMTVGDYKIGRYLVMQSEWEALMGDNPGDFHGDPDLPVETVSWEDAMSFVARLNSLTDVGYRLPTEAEWEFAACGGCFSKGFRFSGCDDPDEVTWTIGNSVGRPHPFGRLKPNELGLHDMSGNIWEWCLDPWRDYVADPGLEDHPRPYAAFRVSRGVSWLVHPMFYCVSVRSGDMKNLRSHVSGFRLAI
jgi:formylglycine-generating enzyme required for sulfatase activity